MDNSRDEKHLDETSLLVSQTDSKGRIIYANDLFLELSEYTLDEVVGKHHNIVRHKDMPKATFKELWKTLQEGKVWQGFVKNKTKNGKFYWVFAIIFPFGKDNYLSVRKMASRDEIEKYEKIYKTMRAGEK